jgi:hypothetical protein
MCMWLVHSCVGLMWLHVNPCTTSMSLWPIWHKCQCRAGRGFLVLDTIPLPWAIPWEENILLLRIPFGEKTGIFQVILVVGPLPFLAIRDCWFWGYQWEGEQSLSRNYIYITVITSATALHCKVKLHQVPLFLQAVVFGEFPWSTESKSRPHSLPGAAGTLRGAHQVLGVPRD